MKQSLSILLPVENCQAMLSGLVHDYLEVASELTPEFEIVIVDNGSCDATIEVADELTTRYPQVRVIRHGKCCSRTEVIMSAVTSSTGSVLLLRDTDCTLPAHDLVRLWPEIKSHDIVLGHARDLVESTQSGWQRVDHVTDAGYQLIRREVFQTFADVIGNRQELVGRLSDSDIRWREVSLGVSSEDLLEEKASRIARQILEGPRHLRSPIRV